MSLVAGFVAILTLSATGAFFMTKGSPPSSVEALHRDSASSAADDPRGGDIPVGEYLYYKTSGRRTATIANGTETYSFTIPFVYERWTGSDRSGRSKTTYGTGQFLTPANEDAYRESGLPMEDLRQPTDLDEHHGPKGLEFTDLSDLPLDQGALRAKLNSLAKVEPSSPRYAPRLFEEILDWGFLLGGPADNKKALIAGLAATPGVDSATKDGLTVVSVDYNGVRTSLWFDAETGELYRYERAISDATVVSGLRAPSGTVLAEATLEDVRLVASTDATQ